MMEWANGKWNGKLAGVKKINSSGRGLVGLEGYYSRKEDKGQDRYVRLACLPCLHLLEKEKEGRGSDYSLCSCDGNTRWGREGGDEKKVSVSFLHCCTVFLPLLLLLLLPFSSYACLPCILRFSHCYAPPYAPNWWTGRDVWRIGSLSLWLQTDLVTVTSLHLASCFTHCTAPSLILSSPLQVVFSALIQTGKGRKCVLPHGSFRPSVVIEKHALFSVSLMPYPIVLCHTTLLFILPVVAFFLLFPILLVHCAILLWDIFCLSSHPSTMTVTGSACPTKTMHRGSPLFPTKPYVPSLHTLPSTGAGKGQRTGTGTSGIKHPM